GLQHGQSLTLSPNGMWEVTFSVAGAADDIRRIYWVDVEEIQAVIVTDNSTPFEGSLVVMATTSSPRATLHHSLDGTSWNEGASVVLTEDAVAYFIAIEPGGIASQIVSKALERRVAWDHAVTANVNEHFLADRIEVDEYLAYSRQFGFFTPITLYRVDGEWVLDPNQAREALARILATATEEAATVTARAYISGTRPVITLGSEHPQPGAHPAPVTLVVEASHERDEHVTVHYTLDGSLPDLHSPTFVDRRRFELSDTGNHVISCHAVDSQGQERYETFHYTITS
ncbi:MAG: chitobiase/beta-hexosaminidase C-terminal domain-containing protein, partial [Actinomycetota bacterium]|nr:chitobiase/beta-hexosaminidase C-terminal domain-containing protein [Actinomycetota bacterium]